MSTHLHHQLPSSLSLWRARPAKIDIAPNMCKERRLLTGRTNPVASALEISSPTCSRRAKPIRTTVVVRNSSRTSSISTYKSIDAFELWNQAVADCDDGTAAASLISHLRTSSIPPCPIRESGWMDFRPLFRVRSNSSSWKQCFLPFRLPSGSRF